MIKEVAFVAIAVSDTERGAEILSGNAGTEADHKRNGRRVGRVRSGNNDDWRWLSPGLATVTRWNDGRIRGRRYRCDDREVERARCEVRHGKNSRRRSAGWRSFAIRTGTSWWCTSGNDGMNLETTKPGRKESGKKEGRKTLLSYRISWFPGFQIFPVFLLS